MNKGFASILILLLIVSCVLAFIYFYKPGYIDRVFDYFNRYSTYTMSEDLINAITPTITPKPTSAKPKIYPTAIPTTVPTSVPSVQTIINTPVPTKEPVIYDDESDPNSNKVPFVGG